MLEHCSRVSPPPAAPEKEMIEAFLDWQRATLLCKLDGVSDEDLRRPGTASGLTLLGLVKHLADVERGWFREAFAGESLPGTWDPGDPGRYWRIEPDETTGDVLSFYQNEVDRAREITGQAGLDDAAAGAAPADQTPYSLRWIMFHMIEETARHIGHADLLREAIDGQVGE